MAASFLDIGKVEIAPNDEGWHCNFGKTVVGRRHIDLRSERRRAQCDAVHIEEQVSDGTGHAAFGSERAVQPETRFYRVQSVQVAR